MQAGGFDRRMQWFSALAIGVALTLAAPQIARSVEPEDVAVQIGIRAQNPAQPDPAFFFGIETAQDEVIVEVGEHARVGRPVVSEDGNLQVAGSLGIFSDDSFFTGGLLHLRVEADVPFNRQSAGNGVVTRGTEMRARVEFRNLPSGAAQSSDCPPEGALNCGAELLWTPTEDDVGFYRVDTVVHLETWVTIQNEAVVIGPFRSEVEDIVDTIPIQVSELSIAAVEPTQSIQIVRPFEEMVQFVEVTGDLPVPLIAEKPLTLRVYPVSLTKTTDVEIAAFLFDVDTQALTELTPEFLQPVNLSPKCTVDRRREIDDFDGALCWSFDFDIAKPPEIDSEVTLVLTNKNGSLLHWRKFNMPINPPSPTLELRAVSVCDDPTISTGCGDEEALTQLAEKSQLMFPTHEVRVVPTSQRVIGIAMDEEQGKDCLDFTTAVTDDIARAVVCGPDPWGSWVLMQLAKKRTLRSAIVLEPTQKLIRYYGISRDIPLGYLGMARLGGISAFSEQAHSGPDEPGDTVAHEVGHMFGAAHTNKPELGQPTGRCTPVDPSTSAVWPFLDNRLQSPLDLLLPIPPDTVGITEFGWDTRRSFPMKGDESLEIMSPCDPPLWISPVTYRGLLNATIRQLQAPSPLEAWRVAVWFSDGATSLEPIFRTNGNPFPPPANPTHSIEVRDGTGQPLLVQPFSPEMPEPKALGPGVDPTPFALELVPVVPGAASIAVLDSDSTQLTSVSFQGSAPIVSLDPLPPGSPFASEELVQWSVTDADSTSHSFWVQYSSDDGMTWTSLADGIRNSDLLVDFASLSGSDVAARIRVLASDGALMGEDTTPPFSVVFKQPTASILAPELAEAFPLGAVTQLLGAARDHEDSPSGTLTTGWTSSIDGFLGSDSALAVRLSEGVHTIDFVATDSDGNQASDQIQVSVAPQTLIDEVIADDDDGDGFGDADDCDDTDASINPLATEIVNNGVDEDCDGSDLVILAIQDQDGDGFTVGEGDCDDTIAAINPFAEEISQNGIDDNCDGFELEDPSFVDGDGDGFSTATGDCDDSDPAKNPVLPEICNGIDDDCEGAPDDGIACSQTCGDLDADFNTDAADVAQLRDALADPVGAALTPFSTDRCNVIAPSPRPCDIRDSAILIRELSGLAPGVQQVCPAAF